MINFNVPPYTGNEERYMMEQRSIISDKQLKIIKSVVMEHLQNNVLNGLKKIQEQPRHC